MKDLGERGQRLWDAYSDRIDGASGTVLLEEACRIADRLDGLDRIIGGDEATWLRVLVPEGGGELVLLVDRVLAEARQQAGALRQLLAGLPLRESTPGDSDDGDEGWLDGV